ncbi:MAG TPA: TIGR02530 family flagellar biosynthesis protein [Candidatus Cloacimonadota bacterium]|jgi:flagellar operon protein|nr:TIGR02530 family flagellar biosynthesis protein [Candidatus Cloacimonadales bacterium]HOE91698.1 TIGR02530 family flagellar biosynthesis protein [Candidatus Cloacimonadota bacterium]HOQ80407.1 TIGR02530 family flagellar biosynthesis protein [Candidatus Cloacimonadota bacterium]HPK41540.1 TIGR02530 family flagellar biosynthesis protein [Candidatus Cloacimonadota bacterium]HPY96333.1 TIGR02530 family flagellar biosynthesis protein [Candidatus Cloacimonadota bacterium]
MINRIVNQIPTPINAERVNTPQNSRIEQQRQQSFAEIFNEQLGTKELAFSAHALHRLEERNISLNDVDKSRLEDAVTKISQKGGKDSLIMMDNVAFVVNIPNRTVVTAVDNGNLKDNIFTQIDSAMILEKY